MTDLEKSLTQTNEQLLAQNQELLHRIQQLTEQVEYLTRKFFGPSSERSKAVAEEQLSLFGDDSFLEKTETTEDQTVEEEKRPRRQKKKGHKARSIQHLPQEIIHCDLTAEEKGCMDCGQVMHSIGTKTIREEVHFVPAKLYKKVYVAHSYACTCQEEWEEAKPIKSASVPQAPIQRSLAGSSTLAWLFHQKFELSLPCYRQENEWKLYGLNVTRRTLSNWIIRSAEEWLAPLYQRLHQHLMKQEVLHADETPYQILNRSDGRPATAEARFWLVRTTQGTSTPVIFYHADLTRKQSVAQKLLEGFSGFLHCDGYSAYKNLPNTTLVGCWAHLRRRFRDLCHPQGKGHAKVGYDFCQQVFQLEKKWVDLTPEERDEKRQAKALPVVQSFFKWIDSLNPMKGKLQEAVHYARNQREEFFAFLKDGRLQVSNNLAEGSIRPLAIGRKNYLFSASVRGAKANAMAYTIIETAKANGLNAFYYLTYLFDHLPNLDFYQNLDLLESFLPWAKKVQLTCQ